MELTLQGKKAQEQFSTSHGLHHYVVLMTDAKFQSTPVEEKKKKQTLIQYQCKIPLKTTTICYSLGIRFTNSFNMFFKGF